MEYHQHETKPSDAQVGLALLVFTSLAVIGGFIAGYNHATEQMNQELVGRKLKHYNQTTGKLVWADDATINNSKLP